MYTSKRLAKIAIFTLSISLFYPALKHIYVFPEEDVKFTRNIPELPDKARRLVTKVIDGDTFIIEGGYSVRIIGIDADEKRYPCYEVAKRRLEELVLGKEVVLVKGAHDLDRYGRYLRYVFVDGRNVGLTLVREGLAVARFYPEEVKYREETIEAERYARKNRVGCKWGRRKIDILIEKKGEIKYKRLTTELTRLRVIDVSQAGDYVDKEVIVEGRIVDTYRSEKNNIFLNFCSPYPYQCFAAVIFNTFLDKFVEKPEEYYLGKIVRIKGRIKKYRNTPEIILEDSSQVEVGEMSE